MFFNQISKLSVMFMKIQNTYASEREPRYSAIGRHPHVKMYGLRETSNILQLKKLWHTAKQLLDAQRVCDFAELNRIRDRRQLSA